MSAFVCGPDMAEHSRESEGLKWCFKCRNRHEFWRVVITPTTIEGRYFEPTAHTRGITPACTDLFPGWIRTWEDDQ